MKDDKIIIATSIAPRNIQQQMTALETWLDQGFHIVSLNAQDEILILEDQVHDIKLVSVNRDARKIFGKPLVYINDILSYLISNGSDIVGIINSDIYLKERKDFMDYVADISKDSVSTASRINIHSLNDIKGATYTYGFDAFFIDKKLLKFFPESQYCLGIPWWDYWLPWVAMKKGLMLKLIKDKKLYHLEHDINYSLEDWRRVGIEFAEDFIPGIRCKLIDLIQSSTYNLDQKLGKYMTHSFLDLLYSKS